MIQGLHPAGGGCCAQRRATKLWCLLPLRVALPSRARPPQAMSDFDVILSISSEMIVVLDEAYVMRHATLSFHTEFGIEPETAVGRPLSEVLPQVLTQVLMSHRDVSLMQVLTTAQPLELHCLADHQNYRVRVNGSGRFLALAFARTNAAPEEGGSEGLADPEAIEAGSSDPLVSLAAVDPPDPPFSPTDTPPGTPSSPRPQRASGGASPAAALRDEDRHALRDGGLASVAELAEKRRGEKKRREAFRPVRSSSTARDERKLGAGEPPWLGHVLAPPLALAFTLTLALALAPNLNRRPNPN